MILYFGQKVIFWEYLIQNEFYVNLERIQKYLEVNWEQLVYKIIFKIRTGSTSFTLIETCLFANISQSIHSRLIYTQYKSVEKLIMNNFYINKNSGFRPEVPLLLLRLYKLLSKFGLEKLHTYKKVVW